MTERQHKFSGTKEVQEHLSFDHLKLSAWMDANVADFSGPLTVKEFKGGQSNPTYQLITPTKRYVLRRKPPGVLMPSAHAVDREYRVIAALGKTDFPIPKAYALCEDVEVIGTMFYVMEMVDGRIFWDLSLPDQTKSERTNIYRSKLETLARLQKINPSEIGLDGFGKTENYIARQVHRWSKIYVASETKNIPLMDKLNTWLPDNIPDSQELSVIHGDYRLDNMVCHPTEPKVIAVLDWELSTLGHPLGDFVYHLAPWMLPNMDGISSLSGLNLPEMGIPTEEEYISMYCELTHRNEIENLEFYKAYTMWRLAAIYQGIVKRVEDGTAASADAYRSTEYVEVFAEEAWKYVQLV